VLKRSSAPPSSLTQTGDLHCQSMNSGGSFFTTVLSMGGDLWGLGGRSPLRQPNISRTTVVIGCEAKYELTKKRFSGGILGGEIEGFCRKRVNFYRVSDFRQQRKTNVQWMNKNVIRNLSAFNRNFTLKKVIQKFGPRNFFPPP